MFDGQDDYVEINSWSGIDGDFTIEAHVKLNSENNFQTFLSHTENGNNVDDQAGWGFYQTGPTLRWFEKNIDGTYLLFDGRIKEFNISWEQLHLSQVMQTTYQRGIFIRKFT